MIIYFFILLNWNSLIPPPAPIPGLMMFVVDEWLEGLNCNIDFWGRGLAYTGEGDTYIYYAKKGHFIEVSPHVSSLIVANGDVGWFSSPYFLVVF